MRHIKVKITHAPAKHSQIITLTLVVSFLYRIPDAGFKRALKLRRRARVAVSLSMSYFCYAAYLHRYRRDTFFDERARLGEILPLSSFSAQTARTCSWRERSALPMTEFMKATSSPEKYLTFLTDATLRETARKAKKKRVKKHESSRRFLHDSLCYIFVDISSI